MSSRFITPVFQALDDNGKAISGAQLFFYEAGSSSTLKDTFSDEALITDNSNPVIADGSGFFPNIYGGSEYRVVFKYAATGKNKNVHQYTQVSIGNLKKRVKLLCI